MIEPRSGLRFLVFRMLILALLFALPCAACRHGVSREIPDGGSSGRRITCPDGMALVPGGTFRMGSDIGFPDEAPVHSVHVESFCLDITEVTVAAYNRCAATGTCTPLGTRAQWPEIFTGETEAWSQFCNAAHPDRAQHPANCVEWAQAERFCAVHGWRLPTEEEFEYAARGGDEERTFPWGATPPDETMLNACGAECVASVRRVVGSWNGLYPGNDGWAGTSPVGAFPRGRGRWGHLDLAGNVWEWTSTLYCPYDSPGCFSDERVVRGSGFLQANAIKARATRRNQDAEWHVSGDSGFRCATSLGPNPSPYASAPSLTLMHQRQYTMRWFGLLGVSLALLFGTGALLGLLGGGGSLLTVPVMLIVVGLQQQTAVAMSLIVMLATASVSSIAHARRRSVMPEIGLVFGAASMAGAYAGGQLARYTPMPVLLAGLVVVMGITARRMLKSSQAAPRDTTQARPRPSARLAAQIVVLGIAVGFVSGLVGVGGGFLIVPVLSLMVGLPMPVSVGTSSLVIAMSTFAGVVSQRAYAMVDWPLAAAFALAASVGTLAGGRYTAVVPPQRLRRWFGVLVLVAGCIVLVKQTLPGLRELMNSRSRVARVHRQDRG